MWPVAVLTAVLDLAEPARRHGWNMDRAALRAVLPLRIQEARGAAVDQLRAHPSSSGARLCLNPGRCWTPGRAWSSWPPNGCACGIGTSRCSAPMIASRPMPGWSMRRRAICGRGAQPGKAAIEHMASLLDRCVTALGVVADADVGPDGAALIERLNLLSALLATALERCGSLARPGERQGLAPDPRLQAEFERAIVRLEGAS